MTDETPDGERVHHPIFGFYLKKQDKLGVECVMRLKEDYSGQYPGAQMNQDMAQFFLKHFPK